MQCKSWAYCNSFVKLRLLPFCVNPQEKAKTQAITKAQPLNVLYSEREENQIANFIITRTRNNIESRILNYLQSCQFNFPSTKENVRPFRLLSTTSFTVLQK